MIYVRIISLIIFESYCKLIANGFLLISNCNFSTIRMPFSLNFTAINAKMPNVRLGFRICEKRFRMPGAFERIGIFRDPWMEFAILLIVLAV